MGGARFQTPSQFGCACQFGCGHKEEFAEGTLQQFKTVAFFNSRQRLTGSHKHSGSVVQAASDLAFCLPLVLAVEKV